MTGTIISSWHDGANAFLAVQVVEANGERIEYIGQVPLSSLAGLTVVDQKAALTAAVAAVRSAQLTPEVSLGLNGVVILTG